jgi:hypothetical protein
MPVDVTTIKVFDAGALACASALRRIGDGHEWRIETGDASPLAGGKVIEVRLSPAPAYANGAALSSSAP